MCASLRAERPLTLEQALGCAPAVPGYLKAMREVCDRYGVLLIFDCIMCGMGRTGYLHAWQADEDEVVPDIQLVGKGLAGGFQPVSGMLIGPKVVKAFENGPSNGVFNHGHTFQNYPIGAAAALETQRVIQDERLLENVKEKGPLLEKKLRQRLEPHRYVGDIRGPKEGLFLGVGGALHGSKTKSAANSCRLSSFRTSKPRCRFHRLKSST